RTVYSVPAASPGLLEHRWEHDQEDKSPEVKRRKAARVGALKERAFAYLAILDSVCVVVVEVTVSSRPCRGVASVPSTPPSWTACVRSSRTQPRPASAGGGRSALPRVAVPAVTSLASPPRHIAIHAPPPGTLKRPPNSTFSARPPSSDQL